MFVNPIDDINNQIDQIDWNFFGSPKWNPLKDSQAYLCAVFMAALGLLMANGCAHQNENVGANQVEKHENPRRY